MTDDELRDRCRHFRLCDEDKNPTPEQMLEYLVLMRELRAFIRERSPERLKRIEETEAKAAQGAQVGIDLGGSALALLRCVKFEKTAQPERATRSSRYNLAPRPE